MKLIKIDWIERDVDFVIQLDDISLEDIKTKEFKTFVKDILIKQMYYRDKDIDITLLFLVLHTQNICSLFRRLLAK